MDKDNDLQKAEKVDVVEIMKRIQQQIQAKKDLHDTAIGQSSARSIPSGLLPAAFYDHLREAQMAHDQIQPEVHITAPSIPIIGALLQPLRQKLHELILFYTNQLATNQVRMNSHLLNALTILAEEVEALNETATRDNVSRTNDDLAH